jgi:uncharacterized membrane protein YkoI
MMKIISLFLVLVAGTISTATQASDEYSWSDIRRMVEEGKILALENILSRYPESEYGKLLDLEVESGHGQIVYELEFLRDDGRVLELEVDAANGQLLEQELE